MVVGGMTDPKGDRSKPPSEQADPDLFTRVVEKRDDGDRHPRRQGAPDRGGELATRSSSCPPRPCAPGMRTTPSCCAVPLNATGVMLIFGRQTNEERKFESGIDAGNPEFGMVGGEALVVFDRRLRPLGTRLHVR